MAPATPPMTPAVTIMAYRLRPGDIVAAQSLIAIMRGHGYSDTEIRADFDNPARTTLTVGDVECITAKRGEITHVECNFAESRMECYDVGAGDPFEIVGYHATYDELMVQLAAMPAHERDTRIDFTQLTRMATIRPPAAEQELS